MNLALPKNNIKEISRSFMIIIVDYLHQGGHLKYVALVKSLILLKVIDYRALIDFLLRVELLWRKNQSLTSTIDNVSCPTLIDEEDKPEISFMPNVD
ncbi:hypothetical protein H5410_061734 [Solanum commersonii]|uniref:Uncharacterized protein n=1 Tax=Solanum commersonii TaxID=4109 RepID=A0A9J5WA33_SOLCO|nr:hypothetical protein H5410_061734 [Solanum commersonii]